MRSFPGGGGRHVVVSGGRSVRWRKSRQGAARGQPFLVGRRQRQQQQQQSGGLPAAAASFSLPAE